ncbi:MAG: aldo/keto reductase [Bacteroidetes bacterium]|nr:aldo/keto reductase [Bacteroidota bacterium]
MEKREFGNTGLKVSQVGFGAGHIGGNELTENEASILLNSVLDLGINLIDTARGYGLSEERIGKYISRRRKDFILSTKIGYGIPGYNDWTYDCIIAGVDEALRIMKTDYIDIVHLHSCPIGTLEYGGVIDALLKTVEAGKVRVAAYSGENNELGFSIGSGRFGSVETSVNITEQYHLDNLLQEAKSKGMGVIAKRPLANVPWRFEQQPHGDYSEQYWLRWKKMDLDLGINSVKDWNETALRFVVFTDVVDCAIVGTSNINHLKENIKMINKGPLPKDIYYKIRTAFRKNNDGWMGQI